MQLVNNSFYFNRSFSVYSETGAHQGESLSPILGLGVNPFTSRFPYRTPPLGDSVRPLLSNQSKRSYVSVKGTMLLFAGKSVHKNKVTRERVDSRNEWRWRLPSISSSPRVTKTSFDCHHVTLMGKQSL